MVRIPMTLRFPRLGWAILHITAIPAVMYLGYILGKYF
jgi:hypothetical protein